MDELGNLAAHLVALLQEWSEDTARKRGSIIVTAAGHGSAQSSATMLQMEDLARAQIDTLVPSLARAGDHARARGAPSAEVDRQIDGVLVGAINVLVMHLQAGGGSDLGAYGARPAVIGLERPRAEALLARYRTGYLRDPATAGGTTYSLTIRDSPGANANQVGDGVTQTSNIALDATAAMAAIERLAASIAALDPQAHGRAEAEADIVALRAQLGRQQPNRSLLREMGISLRTVVEGALSNTLAAPGAAAAAELWNALGLGG
jgi:hypothetical protein